MPPVDSQNQPVLNPALEAARLALEELKTRLPDTAVSVARYLGGYALQMASRGEEVTPALLVDAAERGIEYLKKTRVKTAQAPREVDLIDHYMDLTAAKSVLPTEWLEKSIDHFFDKSAPEEEGLFKFSEETLIDLLLKYKDIENLKRYERDIGLSDFQKFFILEQFILERYRTGTEWLLTVLPETIDDHNAHQIRDAAATAGWVDMYARFDTPRDPWQQEQDLLYHFSIGLKQPRSPMLAYLLEAHKPATAILTQLLHRAVTEDNQQVAIQILSSFKSNVSEEFKGNSLLSFYNDLIKNDHAALADDMLTNHPSKDIYIEAVLLNAAGEKAWNTVAVAIKHGADLNQLDTEKQAAYRQYQDRCALWEKATGAPPPPFIADLDPTDFKPALYADLRDILRGEEYTGEIANVMAFNTAVFFQTSENLLRYIQKWAKADSKQPLHDITQMIKLPAGLSTRSRRDWASAVLAQGPEMAKLVKFADRLPSPAKSADGTGWSLTATRAACAQFAYERANENIDLARLCMKYNVDENDFNKSLTILQSRPETANTHIPDLRIDGAAFDMPDHRLYRLAPGDIRGLFLGDLTDCCQSIGGHGTACAEHGFTSPDGGFYVIESAKGDIVGQSWVWRGDKGELCLDSLEALGERISDGAWLKAVKAIGDELARRADHDVTALHIGIGGKTPDTLAKKFNLKSATPRDYNGYRDSHNQIMVAKISAPPARADGLDWRKAGPSGAG